MFRIEAVPAFRDNYIWALHNGRQAVLIDPGDAMPILTWLDARRMQAVAILVTHHHGDHVGGIADILDRWQIPVFGPAREFIPGRSHALDEGDRADIPELGLTFDVIATPGHTLGHICYHGHGRLFSGDTLFSCGCGRLFEGTAAQMHDSLTRLAGLPEATLLHCAHEYTLPNIGFAQEVEPNNSALRVRHEEARRLRKQHLPTLPVTLATELATNPFLRCGQVTVRHAVQRETGVIPGIEADTFAALRAWKDGY